MKIEYFPKNPSNILSVILVFIQLSVSLDSQIVILLHATILDMALKGLVSSFLMGKAYLRKVDACNHNKK